SPGQVQGDRQEGYRCFEDSGRTEGKAPSEGGRRDMLTIATGNKAVAAAVKEVRPDVIAAYPITPQTEIVEQIAEYVTSGELDSRYIPVESEHSAMAACMGASITGARTFTATS